MRPSGRNYDELRKITLTRTYTKYAEGSVLVEYGDTRIICNATLEAGIPRFLKGKGVGWVTAEYSMLPRATSRRSRRESTTGKQSGRSMEIQRLIGRSLRTAINRHALGEHTITVDCEVIQADGGTRTAAITGGYVALCDAVAVLLKQSTMPTNPIEHSIAAVSVGIYNGRAVLDLDYAEDSNAATDMNVVMSGEGRFIEIQGTAENHPFSEDEMVQMLALAKKGTAEITALQQQALTR